MSAEILSGAGEAVGTAVGVGIGIETMAGASSVIGSAVPEAFTTAFEGVSMPDLVGDVQVPEAFNKAFDGVSMPDLVSDTQVPEAFTKAFQPEVPNEVPQAFIKAFEDPSVKNEVPDSFLRAFEEPEIPKEEVIFSSSEIDPEEDVQIETPFEPTLEPESQRIEEVIQEFLPEENELAEPLIQAEETQGLIIQDEAESVKAAMPEQELKMAQKVETLLVESGIEEEEAPFGELRAGKIPDEVKKSEETQFVRDEPADEARRQDADRAINMVFETETIQRSGSEVSASMNQTPKDEEVSEIAHRYGQKYDGSYSEILKELSKDSFTSKKEAKKAVEKLIYEKPAVKTGRGSAVKEEDIVRVLRHDKYRNPILDFLTKSVVDR